MTQNGDQLLRPFDVIPRPVIDSWLAGKYLVGAGNSNGYQYIGWSLSLRGVYAYDAWEDTPQSKQARSMRPSHWGYAYVDLKDGDLYIAGMRLWTNPDLGKRGFAPRRHPMFWRSEFSALRPPLKSPTFYFVYLAYRDVGSGDPDGILPKDMCDMIDSAREMLLAAIPGPQRSDGGFPASRQSCGPNLDREVYKYIWSSFDPAIARLDSWASSKGVKDQLLGLVHLSPPEPGSDAAEHHVTLAGRYVSLAPATLASTIWFTKLNVSNF